MSTVPPPSEGLGSNFNYFLADGGHALTGVSATITFTSSLVSSSNGFGFQLNCYAQELPNAPSSTPNWQQYVIYAQPGRLPLYGIIDNWKGTVPAGTDAQVINYEQKITNLPRASTIPAGSSLKITVLNNSSNVVTGVTFTYNPAGGSPVSTSVTLANLTVYGTNKPVTAAYESPIAALTFNIVGDYNGNNSTFISGAGTIVYHANQPLTVQTYEPKYTAFQDGTGETSNSVYGTLPPSNSTSITQTWGIKGGVPEFGPARKGHAMPLPPHVKLEAGHNLPLPPHVIKELEGRSP